MYETPVLERYGTLRELTVMLGNSLQGPLDFENDEDSDSDSDSDVVSESHGTS